MDFCDHYEIPPNILERYDSDQFDGEVAEELGKRFAKRTNSDRIRSMTDEELAAYLASINDPFVPSKAEVELWLNWLQREAADG